MNNTISVDLEEYFHAANLENVAPVSSWSHLPKNVELNTNLILEIFERFNTKATFFVLGYIAKRFPELIKKIHHQGHEIASHGYFHQSVYSQTQKQFLRDIKISKKLLEDLCGERVIGYRAPNFSIKRESSPWAYDSLIETGFQYDSSLYPIWHPRYDNLAQSTFPQLYKNQEKSLLIIPLATYNLKLFNTNLRLPAAGGAYWRILPKIYNKIVLKKIEKTTEANCYFHPWELDPNMPIFNKLKFATKIRHYYGCKNFPKTLEYFLSNFKFGPINKNLDLIRAGLE